MLVAAKDAISTALLAAACFRVTSEDDIYVQAVPGFMSDRGRNLESRCETTLEFTQGFFYTRVHT